MVLARAPTSLAALLGPAESCRATGHRIGIQSERAGKTANQPLAVARNTASFTIRHGISGKDLRLGGRNAAVDAVSKRDARILQIEFVNSFIRSVVRYAVAASPLAHATRFGNLDFDRFFTFGESQPRN